MIKRTPPVFIHFFALVFLLIASLAYFYPVLQGKAISQSDIRQYIGMAKEQNDHAPTTPVVDVATEAGDEGVEEQLIAEISIDGMCGVY